MGSKYATPEFDQVKTITSTLTTVIHEMYCVIPFAFNQLITSMSSEFWYPCEHPETVHWRVQGKQAC